MIKDYKDGLSFLEENEEYLKKNKYMSAFFILDSKLLIEPSKKNYALKSTLNDKSLLALKVEPYNLLLYGDKLCLKEILEYIKEKDLELEGVMCPSEIGEELIKISNSVIDKTYTETIGMDFLVAIKISEESSKEVTIPTEDDTDELFECVAKFIKDCGLTDKPDKSKIIRDISKFRIIRKDNKIISFAEITPDTEESLKIAYVYTRDEYRGKGYARKVVNYAKNEILSLGKTATLFVDRKNPISYHLYESLGFKKVFSQGIYNYKTLSI